MSQLDKAYATVTRRQAVRMATVIGAWGWIVVVLCFVTGQHFSVGRVAGLAIDVVVTIGVLTFMAFALRDSYRLLKRLDERR